MNPFLPSVCRFNDQGFPVFFHVPPGPPVPAWSPPRPQLCFPQPFQYPNPHPHPPPHPNPHHAYPYPPQFQRQPNSQFQPRFFPHQDGPGPSRVQEEDWRNGDRWFGPGQFHLGGYDSEREPGLRFRIPPPPRDGYAWSSEAAKALLRNRHIVVIGDSIMRCVYKDIIKILHTNQLLTLDENQKKMETHFYTEHESLVYAHNPSNSRTCEEDREFQSPCGRYLVMYFYVTRCYTDNKQDRMERILRQLEDEKPGPDLIIMNSCLWDISRYGLPETAEREYLKKMRLLMCHLKKVLRPDASFLWLSTPPVSSEIAAGFLSNEVACLMGPLRQSILEINYQLSQLVGRMGFDFLDLHFFLRPMMNHRARDGVHWDAEGHRHITELILTFMARAWNPQLLSAILQPIARELAGVVVSGHLSHFDNLPAFNMDTLEDLDRVKQAVSISHDSHPGPRAPGPRPALPSANFVPLPRNPFTPLGYDSIRY